MNRIERAITRGFISAEQGRIKMNLLRVQKAESSQPCGATCTTNPRGTKRSVTPQCFGSPTPIGGRCMPLGAADVYPPQRRRRHEPPPPPPVEDWLAAASREQAAAHGATACKSTSQCIAPIGGKIATSGDDAVSIGGNVAKSGDTASRGGLTLPDGCSFERQRSDVRRCLMDRYCDRFGVQWQDITLEAFGDHIYVPMLVPCDWDFIPQDGAMLLPFEVPALRKAHCVQSSPSASASL